MRGNLSHWGFCELGRVGLRWLGVGSDTKSGPLRGNLEAAISYFANAISLLSIVPSPKSLHNLGNLIYKGMRKANSPEIPSLENEGLGHHLRISTTPTSEKQCVLNDNRPIRFSLSPCRLFSAKIPGNRPRMARNHHPLPRSLPIWPHLRPLDPPTLFRGSLQWNGGLWRQPHF